MSEVLLTPQGVKEKEARLEYLKTVRMLEIAEELKEARSHGDLSKNAEYDAAKDEQARTEHEIQELEAMLRNVVIIEGASSDVVGIGSKVKIKHIDRSKEYTYHIVGTAEADPMMGKLSDESPVGKAIIGHHVGETVQAFTPNGGQVSYLILEISK